MMNKDYQSSSTCQNTVGSIGWSYCLYHLVHRSLGKQILWVLHPLHLTCYWVLLDWVFLKFEGSLNLHQGQEWAMDFGEETHLAVNFHLHF